MSAYREAVSAAAGAAMTIPASIPTAIPAFSKTRWSLQTSSLWQVQSTTGISPRPGSSSSTGIFSGHIPALAGKQIGFVIAGPLGALPTLKEVLAAWADNGGCHAQFVTDEVLASGDLDALLDAMAARLLLCAETGYLPPRTFYAIGGHKVFRDNIYSGMRFVFQADYRLLPGPRDVRFPAGRP